MSTEINTKTNAVTVTTYNYVIKHPYANRHPGFNLEGGRGGGICPPLKSNRAPL